MQTLSSPRCTNPARREQSPDTQRRSARRPLWSRTRPFVPLYVLFLPVLAYYLIFWYAPMGGLVIAFKNYNFLDGIFGSPWAGLDHFERFLSNGDFWVVFRNTILLAFYRLLFGFPAPILFALLVYEMRFAKIKRFIQTISYLPHFLSWVVVYAIAYNFLSDTGFFNQIIAGLGGDKIAFLGDPAYFRTIFVGSSIWKEIGWSAIIYLAALTRIDSDLYEAAAIDGAGRWRRLAHVTLPGIRTIVSIMLLLALGSILSVSFEQVVVMMNAMVSPVAEVIDYYVYRVGLLGANNFSYATAVGLFRSVIALGIVLIANWFAKKFDEEGGIW
ncbi:ABC transporter permease [Cohnella fermenti]|uniref:Sugar ABC transporter permease n=1 Tax=Cohnella fermenti TaxID=2565925 RepID=A0A4S4BHU2_9BACL|nr:ABC transporter permease subunit [Cohnella fermenti]THF74145.1 sugar ABC transporter permease [Cohnella fermenti]